jgi:hypothetical protein
MNHKSECLVVLPVPNHSYYEVRTICVCGLQSFKPSEYSFESSIDTPRIKLETLPSDKESPTQSSYLE